MAIAAWSAKVVASSICLSVNGRTVLRVNTMRPIGTPSRSSGNTKDGTKPPKSLGLLSMCILDQPQRHLPGQVYVRSRHAQAPCRAPGIIGPSRMYSWYSRVVTIARHIRVAISNWAERMATLSASQRRAADFTSVSSTAWRSNADRLMTLRTSAVAVCCCRDSRSSLNYPRVLHRDYGLVGEVVASSICLSVNGLTSSRVSERTPTIVPSRRSGTPRIVLYPNAC